MLEFIHTFSDDMWALPSIVWWVAFLLGVVTAWILHAYNDNFLFTMLLTAVMYLSVLFGNVGFARIGVFFSPNRDANAVAAASVSMCAMTAMAMILMHLFYAAGDIMQKHRYRDGTAEEQA